MIVINLSTTYLFPIQFAFQIHCKRFVFECWFSLNEVFPERVIVQLRRNSQLSSMCSFFFKYWFRSKSTNQKKVCKSFIAIHSKQQCIKYQFNELKKYCTFTSKFKTLRKLATRKAKMLPYLIQLSFKALSIGVRSCLCITCFRPLAVNSN